MNVTLEDRYRPACITPFKSLSGSYHFLCYVQNNWMQWYNGLQRTDIDRLVLHPQCLCLVALSSSAMCSLNGGSGIMDIREQIQTGLYCIFHVFVLQLSVSLLFYFIWRQWYNGRQRTDIGRLVLHLPCLCLVAISFSATCSLNGCSGTMNFTGQIQTACITPSMSLSCSYQIL